MQRRKSQRHQRAANARWRSAEQQAQAEHDAGVPDVPLPTDMRQPFELLLSSAGGRDLRIISAKCPKRLILWHKAACAV